MMKGLFSSALIILGLCGILKAQEHTGDRDRTPGRPADSWINYSSEAGRFSASMPQTPTDSAQTTSSESGPYTTHLFVAKSDKSLYLIGWVDYDPSFKFNVQMELDANRDNFIKGTAARLTTSRNLTIDGYQSMEFTAETDNSIYRSRVFIVGRRPYQLVVKTDKDKDDSENIARFFNSFKVRVR